MKKINLLLGFLFLLVAIGNCLAADNGQGGVRGKWITKTDGPMAGGQLFLFDNKTGPPPPPPSDYTYLRVPDVTTVLGPDGGFSVQAHPGSYYLVVMKHMDGAIAGPPREGDLFFIGLGAKGVPKTYTVKAGKVTELGTISEATVFRKGSLKSKKVLSIIEGTITDDEGKPVAGARVLAFSSPAMSGKPQYVSEESGANGGYLLRIYREGNYYLKVRNHYGGGQPEPGEIMGGYGEPKAPGVVEAKAGKIIKGIDIHGKRYTGRGKGE